MYPFHTRAPQYYHVLPESTLTKPSNEYEAAFETIRLFTSTAARDTQVRAYRVLCSAWTTQRLRDLIDQLPVAAQWQLDASEPVLMANGLYLLSRHNKEAFDQIWHTTGGASMALDLAKVIAQDSGQSASQPTAPSRQSVRQVASEHAWTVDSIRLQLV